MERKNSVILSDRMRAVVNMVSEGSSVADIGCDHGFMSIYLAEQGICKKVIAMDVHDGPLMHAKENIKKRGLEPYIEIRKSNGLEKIEWILNDQGEKIPEIDSILIAGMGGRLICRILSDGCKKVSSVKELILQPQSEIFLVRSFLKEHGFLIEKEDMVCEDKKYYQMIKAVPAWDKSMADILSYTEAEMYYGPLLLREKHPVLLSYLKMEQENCRRILSQIDETPTRCADHPIHRKQMQISEALSYYE